MLFNESIYDLKSWGRVFQSVEAFSSLIKHIFEKHNLKFTAIENCIPGSNAVFKVGEFIIKIYAPIESGIGNVEDYNTEVFGIKRANSLGLATPKLVASGQVHDRYIFSYLIMEYVNGVPLSKLYDKLSAIDKINISKQLREFTDKMDIKSEDFNTHKLFSISAEKRWSNLSYEFNLQRRNYIKNYKKQENVYVHGDLNPDNILIINNLKICVLDFADALVAPIELEYAGLICDTFKFDNIFINEYFGEYNKNDLTEICLYGLLIHDFGYNIITDNIGNVNEITTLDKLMEAIYNLL